MQIIQAAGLVQVCVSSLLIVTCLVGSVYCFKYRNLEYNTVWGVRIALILLGALWLLTFWMRNAYMWDPFDGLLPVENLTMSRLCNTSTFLMHGIAEPCFLTLVYFLVKSKSKIEAFLPRWPNASLLAKSFLWSLPLLFCHGVILAMSSTLFTSNFEEQLFGSGFDTSSRHCQVPLLSVVGVSLFYLGFLIRFNMVASHLSGTVINRGMRSRLMYLRITFTLGLLLCLVARGAAFAGDRGKVETRYLLAGYFICIFIVLASTLWVLVLRPLLDSIEVPLEKLSYRLVETIRTPRKL